MIVAVLIVSAVAAVAALVGGTVATANAVRRRDAVQVRIITMAKIICGACEKHFEDGQYVLVDRHGRAIEHYDCKNPLLVPQKGG